MGWRSRLATFGDRSVMGDHEGGKYDLKKKKKKKLD
jgi:hypothetical protein